MKARKLHIFFIFSIFLWANTVKAQQQEDVKFEFGKKNLLLDENLVIKLIVKNTEKVNISNFPEIAGFTKGTKQKLFTKKPFTHTITQNYIPSKEGTFRIPSLRIEVNGKSFNSEIAFVNVAKNKISSSNEKKNENVNQDIIFAINSPKNNVYVGESIPINLVLYVPENNTSEIEFPEKFEEEIENIAKKIKSADCLEQRLRINEIKSEVVVLNKKKYLAYKFFQAIYFPLNDKTVNLPSVSITMIQAAKKNGKKEKIKFVSKPISIGVKALPEHPLKDKVSSGNFKLVEEIETKKINTGKSFSYSFKIIGDGNFSTVNVIPPANDSFFDFYPPEITELHIEGQPDKQKQYKYLILAKDSGQFKFEKYFYWVYFNTKRGKYDTLKSTLNIKVLGKAITEKKIEESSDVFEGLDKVDTSIIEPNYQEIVKNLSNLLIVVMLAGSLYIFNWRTRKNNKGEDN